MGEEAVTVVTVWALTVLVKVEVGEEAVKVVVVRKEDPPLAVDAETPVNTDNETIPINAMTTAL
ncbi:MAG: hypothetical protein ACLQEQ_02065 [Nitrososphaerales archaeon]